MAASAVDESDGDTRRAVYRGGWVPLSVMIGYPPPADGGPMSEPARRAVRRALRELVRAGLVEPVDGTQTRDHRDRVYRITV